MLHGLLPYFKNIRKSETEWKRLRPLHSQKRSFPTFYLHTDLLKAHKSTLKGRMRVHHLKLYWRLHFREQESFLHHRILNHLLCSWSEFVCHLPTLFHSTAKGSSKKMSNTQFETFVSIPNCIQTVAMQCNAKKKNQHYS